MAPNAAARRRETEGGHNGGVRSVSYSTPQTRLRVLAVPSIPPVPVLRNPAPRPPPDACSCSHTQRSPLVSKTSVEGSTHSRTTPRQEQQEPRFPSGCVVVLTRASPRQDLAAVHSRSNARTLRGTPPATGPLRCRRPSRRRRTQPLPLASFRNRACATSHLGELFRNVSLFFSFSFSIISTFHAVWSRRIWVHLSLPPPGFPRPLGTPLGRHEYLEPRRTPGLSVRSV